MSTEPQAPVAERAATEADRAEMRRMMQAKHTPYGWVYGRAAEAERERQAFAKADALKKIFPPPPTP